MPIYGPTTLRQRIGIALAGVVTLVGFGVFKIVGNTPNGQKAGGSGSVLQIWASSGAQVGQINSSGSLTLSGNTIVGHNKTGSSRLLIMGTDGGGLCALDQDGTGCTCEDFNNGTSILRVGTAAECLAETYR